MLGELWGPSLNARSCLIRGAGDHACLAEELAAPRAGVWCEGAVRGSGLSSSPPALPWGWQPALGTELSHTMATCTRCQRPLLRGEGRAGCPDPTATRLLFPAPRLRSSTQRGRLRSPRQETGSGLWLPGVLQPAAPLCPAPPSHCVWSFFKYCFYFNIFVI